MKNLFTVKSSDCLESPIDGGYLFVLGSYFTDYIFITYDSAKV